MPTCQHSSGFSVLGMPFYADKIAIPSNSARLLLMGNFAGSYVADSELAEKSSVWSQFIKLCGSKS